MATIDLGKIKFNWKGTYAGGTAYVVDDVVSYNGSSYICILASTGNLPTNATYWEQMSSAGTNGTNGADGTDLGTTLTTQGDIVYRDASGLQRLGAGTSGQVLQTNGTGANPSWGTVSSDYARQIKYFATGSTYSTSSTSYSDTGISLTFDNNLKSTSSIVKITFSAMTGSNSNPNSIQGEYRDASGSKITNIIGNPTFHWGNSTVESSDHWDFMTCICFATVSSTTPIAYRPFWKRYNFNGSNSWLGRSNDSSNNWQTLFMIEEYAE